MYLTGHPMKEYSSYASFSGAVPIRELLYNEENDGKRVNVVALISEVSVKQLKSGQMLCTISAEDMTGSINVICFSKPYALYQNLFSASKILRFTCKVSVREDRPVELILERVEELPKFAQNFVAPKKEKEIKIYIKVDFMDGAKMKSVSPILEESDGETPVYIYCENDKKSYLAPEKMWVENSDEIIIKLKNILGEENVKIVEK